MASVLNVPERGAAEMAMIPLKATTRENKDGTSFEAEVPKNLPSAIAIEGEKKVFKRYIQSLVIELQGEKRRELEAPDGEKKPRKRASYLETLGI